jgi:hypothetical protein
MNSFLKVKDHPGLIRDMNSQGIVNVDSNKYNAHKLQKQSVEQQKRKEQLREDKINKLEDDVIQLKESINEILAILRNK